MTDPTKETREEFLARYPRPKSSPSMPRVLVRCSCDEYDGEHWAWSFWDFHFPGIQNYETLAEEEPVFADPKPWICTSCSDRFAREQGISSPTTHVTVYRPRPLDQF